MELVRNRFTRSDRTSGHRQNEWPTGEGIAQDSWDLTASGVDLDAFGSADREPGLVDLHFRTDGFR